MQLTVSELREIVKKFMKEQFNVDKFRISYAWPSEVNKIWTLGVVYSIEPPIESGDLKYRKKIGMVRSCVILVDDEKKKIHGWREI